MPGRLPSIKGKLELLSSKRGRTRDAGAKALSGIRVFAIDFRAILGYICYFGSGEMIAENVESVRERIRAACSRCGRDPKGILLVAVTKTFGPELIREAVTAGLFDFGENYVQELNRKREQLGEGRIRWHFIGHLQSNKAKYIADYVHLVHSVDSERLAGELDRRGGEAGRTIDVLVEIHTTDEATKTGLAPGRTVEFVKEISKYGHLRVQGLMTMGPFSDDPNDSRPSFRQVLELKRRIEQEGIENVSMRHLSMGMSHDFEVGIEEGATIVRIGTAIFGERAKSG
jgi:pyridoxal phosphate enzyme (YggS family)